MIGGCGGGVVNRTGSTNASLDSQELYYQKKNIKLLWFIDIYRENIKIDFEKFQTKKNTH